MKSLIWSQRLVGVPIAMLVVFATRESHLRKFGTDLPIGFVRHSHAANLEIALVVAVLLALVLNFGRRRSIGEAVGKGIFVGLFVNVVFDQSGSSFNATTIFVQYTNIFATIAASLITAYALRGSFGHRKLI
jgi:hypothetical protein